jgi:hypothetical protein
MIFIKRLFFRIRKGYYGAFGHIIHTFKVPERAFFQSEFGAGAAGQINAGNQNIFYHIRLYAQQFGHGATPNGYDRNVKSLGNVRKPGIKTNNAYSF